MTRKPLQTEAIQLRLTPKLKGAVESAARALGMSRAEFVREAMRAAVMAYGSVSHQEPQEGEARS